MAWYLHNSYHYYSSFLLIHSIKTRLGLQDKLTALPLTVPWNTSLWNVCFLYEGSSKGSSEGSSGSLVSNKDYGPGSQNRPQFCQYQKNQPGDCQRCSHRRIGLKSRHVSIIIPSTTWPSWLVQMVIPSLVKCKASEYLRCQTTGLLPLPPKS